MSRRLGILVLLCFGLAPMAQAHVASNGFLTAKVTGQDINGSIELSVRDAELAVGLDANNDGQITWGELRNAQSAFQRYVEQHLRFSAQSQACTLVLQSLQVNDRVDGIYVWLPFAARCPQSVRQLTIDYTVLQDEDPSHRGLLTLAADSIAQTGVLGGRSGASTFSVYSPTTGRAFLEYLQAGIQHIWSGIDHLLFLISLLLPAVLLRRNGHWEPVRQPQNALLGTVKVVTAFTLAHSITLTLAALNVVHLPSRLTESVIAASIVIAALNNVFPLVTERRARIAFAFGLLHGFGFASVLADMGLPHGAKLLSLLAFNLGIEAGQLAVVLVVMPIVYGLRTTVFYRRAILPWGSAGIALLALFWLVQRALLPTV